MNILKISTVAVVAFSLMGFTTSCNEKANNEKMMENMTAQDENAMMENNMGNRMSQETDFKSIMASYSSIKDALVADDSETARQKAKELMKMSPDMQRSAKAIAESDDLSEQRKYFSELSSMMYQMAKNGNLDAPIYWNNCPMALNGQGANWLSMNEKIRNPYMGQKMPGCGSIQETITN